MVFKNWSLQASCSKNKNVLGIPYWVTRSRTRPRDTWWSRFESRYRHTSFDAGSQPSEVVPIGGAGRFFTLKLLLVLVKRRDVPAHRSGPSNLVFAQVAYVSTRCHFQTRCVS